MGAGEDVDARIAALKPAGMQTPDVLESACVARCRHARFVFNEISEADVVASSALVQHMIKMCEAIRTIEDQLALVDAATAHAVRAGMWERILRADDAAGVAAIVKDVKATISQPAAQ